MIPPAPPPQTPVWAKLPLPVKVVVLAPLLTAATVSSVTPPAAGSTRLNVGAPFKVVVPTKVTPAVPLETFAPPVTPKV